jgi:predicted phosphodiesterase
VNTRDPLVGVISDTHGLLRPQALAALRGSDLIIHAGDVGQPELLEPLRALAPLHVVRGNVDHGAWAARLPITARVDAGGHVFHVLHNIAELELWLNPGSAGPRRFSLPITVARVRVAGGELHPEIVTLAA